MIRLCIDCKKVKFETTAKNKTRCDACQRIRNNQNTAYYKKNPRSAMYQHKPNLKDSEYDKTLDEVATEMGITRERVRQIQAVALGKLRRKAKSLEVFL